MNLLELTNLARQAPYNEGVKNQFRLESRKWLKQLAKDLLLTKGSFDVRFNPGGIAVSGDAILHHDRFYLHLSESGCYWRTCEGRKDYTGGPNVWALWYGRLNVAYPVLVQAIRKVIDN